MYIHIDFTGWVRVCGKKRGTNPSRWSGFELNVFCTFLCEKKGAQRIILGAPPLKVTPGSRLRALHGHNSLCIQQSDRAVQMGVVQRHQVSALPVRFFSNTNPKSFLLWIIVRFLFVRTACAGGSFRSSLSTV